MFFRLWASNTSPVPETHETDEARLARLWTTKRKDVSVLVKAFVSLPPSFCCDDCFISITISPLVSLPTPLPHLLSGIIAVWSFLFLLLACKKTAIYQWLCSSSSFSAPCWVVGFVLCLVWGCFLKIFFFIGSLSPVRTLGHLTRIRHSSYNSGAINSCQCVQYLLCVSKQWYGCQCLGCLMCT